MGAEHAATLEVSPKESPPKHKKTVKCPYYLYNIYLFIYDFISYLCIYIILY